MQKLNAKELLYKHRIGRTSKREREVLDQWYDSIPVSTEILSEKEIIRSLQNIDAKLVATSTRRHILTLWPKRLIAAAIIFVVVGIGLLYYFDNKMSSPSTFTYANDIAPGTQGATLTLANGKTVRLEKADQGLIINQDGVSVSKTLDGKLIYEYFGDDHLTNTPNAMHTLSTSKGETYKLHLPDGSEVHLNASTTLSYHPNLTKKGKRIVVLKGEGYFEIAKDKSRPFIVQTEDQEIEVLGTKFNVNGYPENEAIETTLIEGVVRISVPSGVAKVINPGQQARVISNNIKVINFETQYAISWMNDYFMFNHERLDQIMQTLARWYNVEVEYKDEALKKSKFFGSISKYENVSKALRVMERTNVARFEIEGRKIIVKLP